MERRELKINDVVQLTRKGKFYGMLLVVTDPKSWGAQGFLMSSCDFIAVRYNGRAFFRPKFEDMEYVGHLAVPFYEENDGIV